MWLPKRQLAAVLLGLLPLALPMTLAGCGFRPVYGKHSIDPAVQDELASISVGTIQNRDGQLTRNALVAKLNPKGQPSHPEYYLEVQISIYESEQALRKDDTSTRNQVTYNLIYNLSDGERKLTIGNFSRTFSYDYLEGEYNNITAHDDTARRAAESLAEDVRLSLAAYFAKAKKSNAGYR